MDLERSRSKKQDSPNYRPEIEGIRAVACLLVATFHIWLGRVSGGVDVFFVIAGFLTTVTLLGHVRRFGRIRPGTFLSRLATRLFPSSAIVLAVVAVLTFFVLWPPQWKQTFTEVVASALYVENWQLYRSGIDYLAQDDFHSPVQNFWAMSVQGQFYLIWAVMFIGIAIAMRFVWKRPIKPLLIGVLLLAIVVSFVYSLREVDRNQTQAYYNTFARVWEFGLGSIAAVVLPGLRIPAWVRTPLGWIGLFGIISCGFLLQVSTQFPGVAALWPTVSAVLILVAGTGASTRFGAERLLGTAPLVWLGGLGYGIYLWHWPILIFWVETTDERPSLLVGLAIIGASIALAWLTKRFIEDPLLRPRRATLPGRSWVRTSIPVAMMLVAALVGGASLAAVNNAIASDVASARERSSAGDPCFGAAAMADPGGCAHTFAWRRSVPELDAGEDGSPEIDGSDCATSPTGTQLKECIFGQVGSSTRVVLIGNSHAASLFPAFEKIAVDRGWELHVFYKNGCVFNTAPRLDDSETERDSCLEWGEKLQQRLAEQPPYDYSLNAYSAVKSHFLDDQGNPSDEAGIEGFREAWAPMIERGTTILAIADNPVLETTEQLKCEYRPGDARSCSVPRSKALDDRDLVIAAATDLPGALPIDLTAYYCDETECPLVIGGVKVYRDRGHLTATFASTLAPYLGKAISDYEAAR
ncbi:acyltransferase family protein [Herbiconiux sp. KACC 21604]|uniref:acyltransferase family protein n=1 Tax=unclassified Herbiconiux TaxID=2618217 RepID=UPI001491B17E|nr:acyltransferase family protein [Herbiconiux sp. SALV-R1]QJU54576.1 acyltransferase [Herbiconiux sp. SALV-R1]WPO85661.1 acyltransferase family protein [Herbiconiux sp. KACC 21604]